MDNKPVYLNGKFINTEDGFPVHNPATGEPFVLMSAVGAAEVRKAISDADEAWTAWRELTALERGDYLRAVADGMENRLDEISKIITLENGKPLSQSQTEVRAAVDHFRWFAEEARRAYGRVVPYQAVGKRHLVVKTPVGVVGAIAPWNFPLMLAARKVAPAMAAGCPVILKPASQTPLSSVVLAECMDAAGIPAGIFQLVAGKAGEIGDELLSNPACRKISFTGSTEVGQHLIRASAQTVTNLSLELGGHAPVLIFADADLGQAVDGAVIAKFRNTGQSCIAANRILVQKEIYDEFADKFCERVRALKTGNGLEQGIDIGPLVNRQALETAVRHIEGAVQSGATVLCGGKQAEIPGSPGGFFLEPTVLGNVPDDAECMREETFAPIAPLGSFVDEEEAVTRANNTEYGLAAYAFTRDVNRIFRLMDRLEAGSIGINDAVLSTSQSPFGGFKQSGIGRELGVEGLDSFLETKHISFGGVI